MELQFQTIRDRTGRISFDEYAHAYGFDGKPVEVSVSRIAASLKTPFDGLVVASRCGAAKREQWTGNPNCSNAALVAAWKQNGIEAAEAGTRLHAQIEAFHRSSENTGLCPIIQAWMRQTFPRPFVTVFPELRIAGQVIEGDSRVVAGTIDLLSYDHRTETWSIWDWKRGNVSDLNGDEDALGIGVRMSNLRVYSVQLALYARILRFSYGIVVGQCRLVHTIEGREPELIDCDPDADAIAEIAALMR